MNSSEPQLERNSLLIRQLNDAFRTTLRGGRLVATSGINALPIDTHARIMKAVVLFNDFGPDNDPYGERDFGSFDILGHKVLWKIDYYDKQARFGSPDPADPAKTTRILTVMLASEY